MPPPEVKYIFLTQHLIRKRCSFCVVYAAHAANRGSMPLIAEQQLGYSHPLGLMVDLLLGGGRCNFSPNSTEGSCRTDDFDLLTYAEEQGFTVATSREEFNALGKGQGQADLPFLGLFSDGKSINPPDAGRAKANRSQKACATKWIVASSRTNLPCLRWPRQP